MKSGKVVVSSNIAQNNSSRLLEVIYDHNLPKFTRKFDQSRNKKETWKLVYFFTEILWKSCGNEGKAWKSVEKWGKSFTVTFVLLYVDNLIGNKT